MKRVLITPRSATRNRHPSFRKLEEAGFDIVRSIAASDRSLKAGRWERHPGFELEGKILGLVGCGKIGRLVTRFAGAFGMRVLGFDPLPTWEEAPAGFRYAELPEVYENSDIVKAPIPGLLNTHLQRAIDQ